GRGDASYLARYQKLPTVEVRGVVEDLSEEYQRAEAALVPLFFGSGTRVKIVEAARYGCPVISTPLGARGLPLENAPSFLEATSADDWIARLTATSSDLTVTAGSMAFETLAKFCDPERT